MLFVLKKYRYHLITTIVLILFSLQIYRDLTRTNILIWSEKPITWENFKPSSWLPRDFGATMKTSIRYNINIDKKKAKVFAFMNTKKSRVLDSIEPSTRMLRHEQYHFNISEYHARLLRKKLIELREEKITKKVAAKYLELYGKKLNQMQDQYDSITRHGIDLIEQHLWESKIDSLLKKTDKYKNINLYKYSFFIK
jgi:hypothetical protein